MPNKLVILDRDGTINEASDEFVKSPDEWRPLPGALEAIARLNHAGFQVVVVSNQAGLGRGLLDMVQINAMHAKMHKMLAAVGANEPVPTKAIWVNDVAPWPKVPPLASMPTPNRSRYVPSFHTCSK